MISRIKRHWSLSRTDPWFARLPFSFSKCKDLRAYRSRSSAAARICCIRFRYALTVAVPKPALKLGSVSSRSSALCESHESAPAGRMGIDAPALSRLETGKMLNPRLVTLHKGAAALGRKLEVDLSPA